MSDGFHYLLGDSTIEQERLSAQAALWDPVSHGLFDRIQVEAGWRVLEIGPGTGTLNLELRRRIQGPVDVVEQSAAFCASLRECWRQDAFGEGWISNATLDDAPLPRAEYDLIFARWVFLFLPDPMRHVRKLASALKPGGLIAVQDYYDRGTFCLVPRPPDWGALLAADHAFFATQGGEGAVAARLPQIFETCGLEVIDIEPAIKTGRPGSPVWRWLSDYYLPMLQTYQASGAMTAEQARRISAAWSAAERRPTSLLVAPAMLDVVARMPAE